MVLIKSLLIFFSIVCLSHGRSGNFPKGFKDINNHLRNVRTASEVTSNAKYPYMGSLQSSAGDGHSCFGFGIPFVASSWALALPSVVSEFTSIPRNPKKMVILTHTVHPAHGGYIHRIKKTVEVGTDFVLLKTSFEVHPYLQIAPKSYAKDETETLTFLYWSTYQDSLYEETDIAYSSTQCGGGTTTTFCTDSYDTTDNDIGSPILSEDDELIGLLTSGGSYETFIFVPYFRDRILNKIASN